jgi:mRNA interferase RelE/StbE
MPYEIILAPEAVEDLHGLKANLRANVRSMLERHLRHQPMLISKSCIKRLRGMARPQYRLRIDDLRIYYDVSEAIVEVLAIVDKSDAESWLEQFGEPDETDPALGSEE